MDEGYNLRKREERGLLSLQSESALLPFSEDHCNTEGHAVGCYLPKYLNYSSPLSSAIDTKCKTYKRK